MTVVSMSRAEIDRAHVLRDLLADRIRAREASQLIGVTRRQVFRLLKAYRVGGPLALASKKRGKPSNRSYPAIVRTEALSLIKANYADFGPTLAAEKLAERHALHLGVETVRRWMLADGIWRDRRQRLIRAPASPSTRVLWRAGPDRWVPTLAVRGPGPAVHPARLHRRRDQPLDASAVRRDGVDV
jgi:Homeodomain-like domain